MDRTLNGTMTSDQSRTGSNVNESMTRYSPDVRNWNLTSGCSLNAFL